MKTLGDVIELAYGKALRSDKRVAGSVPVYGSGGIVGFNDESIVHGPGIILGRKGNVGSVYWSDGDFFPIDTVFYIVTEHSLHYIYYNLLLTQRFLNSDAAVPGLNRNQAYLNPILIPDARTCGLFSEHIEAIFAQLRMLRRKNELLGRTRDLLLPKLISGQLNVENLTIDIDRELGATIQTTKGEPKSFASRKSNSSSHPKPTPYKDDAAVLCAVVDELQKAGRPTTEFFVQKHVFAMKHRRDFPANCKFAAMAAGPWSHELKRKSIFAGERIGWLHFDEAKKVLEPGRNIAGGLEYARTMLGERYAEIQSTVQDFAQFGSTGLGKWMTVFKVVCDLRDKGTPVTRANIQTGIDKWKGKRAKADFSVEMVNQTINGMVKHGWFSIER